MQKFRGLTILGVMAVAGCNLTTNLPTSQRLGFITVSELGSGDTATSVTIAAFGPDRSDQSTASMVAPSPLSTASTAPSARLRTQPSSPVRLASRSVKAR